MTTTATDLIDLAIDTQGHPAECACDDCAALAAGLTELDALRAENEDYRTTVKRLDRVIEVLNAAQTELLATTRRLDADNQRLRAAYKQIEDAPNEDIRKLAIAHMWTVLNEAFGRDNCH